VNHANYHDPSVTTEDKSAALESGATDESRSRDSSVLAHRRQTLHGTDEPSAHPWHQIPIGKGLLGKVHPNAIEKSPNCD
jgi:hypothetical protein